MTNNTDQKRLLEIVNTIKDINRTTDEKCDISYKQIQDLDYADRILADAFGFEQPKCEHGRPQIWSDYQVVQKRVDKKSKK